MPYPSSHNGIYQQLAHLSRAHVLAIDAPVAVIVVSESIERRGCGYDRSGYIEDQAARSHP